MGLSTRALCVAAVAIFFLCACPFALATFPGANGKIAFSRGGDIWIMDPDGSNQEQITSGPASDSWPSWAPDGSALAFGRVRDGHHRVFIYDLVNGLRRFGHFEQVQAPAWSPDGRRLVLAKVVYPALYGGLGVLMLAVAPLDGSSARTIPGTAEAGVSDWSPLGDRIAYSHGEIEPHITTISPSGADPMGVPPGNSYSPSWSPDGARIAFRYQPLGSNGRIYVVNADGSGLVEVTTSDPLRFDDAPSWSPDGSRIVFWRSASPYSPSDSTIELMDANGTNLQPLTNGESPDWQPLVPPRNVRRPSIAGVPRSGRELVASRGGWFGTPELTFSYQWRRCGPSGGPCQDIPGATDPTYVLTDNDVRGTSRVFVTATNDQGESLAWSLATPPVGASSLAPTLPIS